MSSFTCGMRKPSQAGPALVRAMVAVGVVLPAVTDDADLDLAGAHHPHPALGDLALPAHQHFRHRFPLSSVLHCVSTLPHRYRRLSSSGMSKSCQPGTSATS